MADHAAPHNNSPIPRLLGFLVIEQLPAKDRPQPVPPRLHGRARRRAQQNGYALSSTVEEKSFQ